MRFLYSTTDRNFWENARLALHREGILTFESDVDAAVTGLGSIFMLREYRLYILDENDMPRALEIIAENGGAYPAPDQLPQGWFWNAVFFVLGLVIAALWLKI